MTLNEMTKMFLYSRKRGVNGARRKCTEKTIKIYRSNLEIFTNFMAQKEDATEYTQIKQFKIESFSDWMDEKVKDKQWSRATVLQVLRSLKAFMRWVDKDPDCVEAGLKGVQRWLPVIEKTPRRRDIPPMADIKRFANSFNTANPWHYRDYVATCLLLTNGIRIGELCNLTIECAKLEERTLIVTGKTGPRLVPITQEMVQLLKGWLKRRTGLRYASSPYVFVSRLGPQMDTDGFVKAFLKHRRKHNLPRISAHTFRHVFCTHYLKEGGDIERLRKITGHTSYDMLKDYLHDADSVSKTAHEELERANILKEL